MKKIICGFVCLMFFSGSLALANEGKIDPLLSIYSSSAVLKNKAERIGLFKKNSAGDYIIETIVTMKDGNGSLSGSGAHIRWQRGDIIIADLPFERLREIAALPQVRYIEAVKKARLCTDISMKEINAIKARQTTSLTGKGILVGIIDSGIDFRHQDFRKADGTTRVKYILDLSVEGTYYGGTIYDENDINAALSGALVIDHQDKRGHGTHVAGIAAGDGSNDERFGAFCGTAPEAELVIVKAMRSVDGIELRDSDQLIALGFVDSVAVVLNKPYVINLSFGTNYGPHDGTSAVERYMDQLSGSGKVVVAASGNDGDDKKHAVANLSGSSEITLSVPFYISQIGRGNNEIILDGWYDGAEKAAITVVTPGGKTFGPVADGQNIERNSTEGFVRILNGYYQDDQYARPGVNPFNHDKEILVMISDEGTSGTPANGTWSIRLSGNGGDVHFWMTESTMEAQFAKGLSYESTVTIPGTAKTAITCGAYTTRESWNDIDGNTLTIDVKGTITVGDIAAFSGAGPTRDGRSKPEITAPGQIIASSLSEYALPSSDISVFVSPLAQYPNAYVIGDSIHALTLGTSMAAPHVAGLCALLLEKYPTADANKIRQLIANTARKPQYSGNTNQWGSGKIDAYQAVMKDINALPEDPDSLITDEEIQILGPFPNPCSDFTIITYFTSDSTKPEINIKIYNRIGQFIRKINTGIMSDKINEISWDCRDAAGNLVANGIYFMEIFIGKDRKVRKVTVMHDRHP